MSTVGINFGAATSGTGFNVATTVASITALSSAIENPWNAQLTSLKAQDTALTSYRDRSFDAVDGGAGADEPDRA